MVAVVVPFRGGCPHREHAWSWVRARYEAFYGDLELIEAKAPPGAWCKAAATVPAIAAISAEIVIQADADVWVGGLALEQAIRAVRAGAPWAVPHMQVHRLSKEGTAAVRAGAPWREQRCEERPYCGVLGGGVLVARRETLEAVPLDQRFVGWGQEDESQAMALVTLAGEPWRGDADLVHLWHPPAPRWIRRRGSRESWDLRGRYAEARTDPAAMAALIEESRVASATAEHPREDHPALGVRG